MLLSNEQMDELSEKVMDKLLVANRDGSLFDLLKRIGWGDLLPNNEEFYNYSFGYICVLGATEVKQSHLLGAAKELGFKKDRFKMVLDYNSIEGFNFNELRFNPNCAAVLVGPMPHSTSGTGDFSSAITAMEAPGSGYPPVTRLMAGNELKITKNNFSEALVQLLKNGTLSC